MDKPAHPPKSHARRPLILILETSGRTGSIALAHNSHLIEEKEFTAAFRHSAELFGAISLLLDHAAGTASDIGAVYISAGPGSFTGLRIAASFAKAMHLAIGAKIVAVPTLDVIAANTADFQAACGSLLPRVGVILDAKRGRFFAAIYETKPPQTPVASTENAEIVAPAPMRKVLPDALLTAEEFLEMARPDRRPISLLGEGLVYYKNKFAACGVDFLPPEYWNPKASKVHMLGWQRAQHNLFEDPIKFTPAYLSRPDAIVKSRP